MRMNPTFISMAHPYTFACLRWLFDYTNAPPTGCSVPVSADLHQVILIICNGSCISFSSLSLNATSWIGLFMGNTCSSAERNPETFVTIPTVDCSHAHCFQWKQRDTVYFDNSSPLIRSRQTPCFRRVETRCFRQQDTSRINGMLTNAIIPGATNIFMLRHKEAITVCCDKQ